MNRKQRRHRTAGRWCIGAGIALILASIPQFAFGIPVSEGFAPAGLSLGPLALICGFVLYHSGRPGPGGGTFDDSSTFRNLDLPTNLDH